MKNTTAWWSPRSGSPSLWRSCALLWFIILLFYPAFAWFGYGRHGADGLAAVAVAGAVCLLGGTLALLLAALCRGPQVAVYGVLFGMMFRMGLPLLVGITLSRRGGLLAGSGVFGMLLLYYLVTLTVETRLIRPGPKASQVS